jgi:hypothetical protein
MAILQTTLTGINIFSEPLVKVGSALVAVLVLEVVAGAGAGLTVVVVLPTGVPVGGAGA